MDGSCFHAHRHFLRPQSRDAVRRWQREMDARSEEVRQTLRAEAVELELVLFEPAEREGGLDSLIFVLRTDDDARAVAVFERSTAAIDQVHRVFLQQVSLGGRPLEVIGCHEAGPAAHVG